MVLLEGKPLIIGGCNVPDRSGTNQIEVEVYEETDNRWHFKADMPYATKNFAAVVLNHGTKVFVLGGVTSSTSITNKVYSYELSTNTWVDIGRPIPIHVGIGGPLSALVTLPDSRNGILLVGGLEYGFTVHRSSYFLDLATMTWENLASFATSEITVYNGNMVQTGGSLYVIPIYQDIIRQNATNILVRNMSSMNNPWIIQNVTNRFELGPTT